MSASVPFTRPLPRSRIRPRLLTHLLLGGLAVITAVSLVSGALSISGSELFAIVRHALGGADMGFSPQQYTVFMELRLPRTVLAILAGVCLASAGAALQALFRNPLADPGLIGVASGASLGAGCVIVLGVSLPPTAWMMLAPVATPLAAFLGGLVAALIVYRIAAGHGGAALAVMLLAGIAVNAVAGAGLGLFTALATNEQLRNLSFWSLGSLSAASWQMLALLTTPIAAALLMLWRDRAALSALMLGEAEAGHLGVNVATLKTGVFVATALLIGPLVAFTGVIGFVGLVAPHIVRLLIGPDFRYLLPNAALLGACIVLAADLVARTMLVPAELPIGVLTALLGTPVFLYLLVRERRAWLPA